MIMSGKGLNSPEKKGLSLIEAVVPAFGKAGIDNNLLTDGSDFAVVKARKIGLQRSLC